MLKGIIQMETRKESATTVSQQTITSEFCFIRHFHRFPSSSSFSLDSFEVCILCTSADWPHCCCSCYFLLSFIDVGEKLLSGNCVAHPAPEVLNSLMFSPILLIELPDRSSKLVRIPQVFLLWLFIKLLQFLETILLYFLFLEWSFKVPLKG